MKRWTSLVFWLALVIGAAVPRVARAQGYRGGRSWAFTGISPTKGPWGKVVILSGYGFTREVKVSYNGKQIPVIGVSRRSIRVRVPEGAKSGWFEVAFQGRSLRAPKRFIVVNDPFIKLLVPSASPPGNWVQLRGRFLRPDMKFWVGRFPVKKRFVNDRMIMLFVHDGLRGGPISFRWQGRRVKTKFKLLVRSLPTVRSFAPASGWVGTKVRIVGRHFCKAPKVMLGDISVPVLAKTPRHLDIKIPRGAVTGSISIECFGKRIVVGTFEVAVPYATVMGVEPARGGSGRWVEIRGRGFTPKDRFWLGAVPLTKKRFVSSTRYRVFVPKGAVRAAIQFVSHGKRFVSKVIYDVLQPPRIERVQPLRGWYGDRITLVGRGFCSDARVFVGGKEAKVVGPTNGRRLVVEIAAGTRGGRISVRCGQFRAQSRRAFQLAAPAGALYRVRPAFGPPGTKVVVYGKGFLATDKFFLNGLRLPGTFKNSGRFELQIPRGARSGVIEYVHLGKRVRTKVRFTVGWPRPIVSGYEPGKAWYGDEVTVTGRRICSAPSVTLGKKRVEVLSASPDRIRIRIPEGARTGNLVVSCPGHKVVVRPAIKIKPPFAQVYSVFPKAGPWGTWVTVSGDNFSRSDRFFLGDRPLARKFVARHEVQVLVGEGAKSGELILQSAGHRVRTGKRFKVIFPVPFLKGFSPSSGWYGQQVELKGESFCLHPKVLFGRKEAAWVKRVSHTQILTRVPRGASTGPVFVVCYGNKKARSRKLFILAPPLARVTSVDPDRGGWNRWIRVKGHNFSRKTKFYLGRLRLKMDFRSPSEVRLFIPPGAKTGLLYVESFGRRRDSTFSYVVRRRKARPRRRR